MSEKIYWENGYLLAEYDQECAELPASDDDIIQFVDGFTKGALGVDEYSRLKEYFIEKCGQQFFNKCSKVVKFPDPNPHAFDDFF